MVMRKSMEKSKGETPLTSFRLDEESLEILDEVGKVEGMNRTQVIKWLLRAESRRRARRKDAE